jgi:hypothetical protein
MIMYNFQDYSVLYDNAIRQFCDGTISLRGENSAHKTSLTPFGFLLSKCLYQVRKFSGICMLGVPLSTIFLLNF